MWPNAYPLGVLQAPHTDDASARLAMDAEGHERVQEQVQADARVSGLRLRDAGLTRPKKLRQPLLGQPQSFPEPRSVRAKTSLISTSSASSESKELRLRMRTRP